ncbi:MAG: nuclear transport factor 2 family protein [Pricia sp.]|nr:nuclear transport factor 2 family protein [Pricia sp.]
MKNLIPIYTVIFLIAATGCKQHEKKPAMANDMATSNLPAPTKDEVAMAVKNFNKAMVDPDEKILENLCSDELTYGHSSGLIQNKTEFIDDLVNGPFDFSSVEAPEQTIHLSGNTAIVRHIFLAQATNKGEPVDIRIGNVQAYHRDDDGKWKLLARQAYKLPPVN